MKLKEVNKVFNILSIGVISIVLIGFASTYLSDYLTQINWFGETPSGRWSLRHYWYSWGNGVLLLIAIIRLYMTIEALTEKRG